MFNEMSDEELLAAYQELDRETKELSLVVFGAYNCRDVEILKLLDIKYKLLKLVAQMASDNTCNYKDMLGDRKSVV